MSPTLIDPKKHHQLFLDSRALVSEQGTTRTLHPPQRCGPLITGGIQSRSALLWNPDEERYVHRRSAPPTRPARAPKRRPLPSSAKIRRRQPKRHPQRQPRRLERQQDQRPRHCHCALDQARRQFAVVHSADGNRRRYPGALDRAEQ